MGRFWVYVGQACLRPVVTHAEAAAKALAAMLVGSLGNRQRLVWRDVFGLRLALGTLGSTVGGQLCR